MPATTYFKFGLGSCAFYGFLFALGFFNTDAASDWHMIWAVFLILTGVCAAQCVLLIIFCKIREGLGYGVDIVD